MKFEFEDLAFQEEDGRVRVGFLRRYRFYLDKQELLKIGPFRIERKSIEFEAPEKKASRFTGLLAKGFEGLVDSATNRRTVYVHRNSGIPLVGEGVFGLIDRNTNCIEVKPLTSCNLDCVYCSVDAGSSSGKGVDYVVEEEYLVDEFNKLATPKAGELEAHIGPQGEPLLYAPIVDLIRDLKANPKVKVVSLDTNGTLLTKSLIDELAQAGLTRLNVSVQSLNQQTCSRLAGCHYNIRHVLEMVDYAKDKMSVLLAPVLIPGMNDDDLLPIIERGMAIESSYPTLGVQNFLNYKRGRNPVSQRSWDEFYAILRKIEQEKGVKLVLCKEDFGIAKDAKLEKPFKKRDVVKAVVVCAGPEPGEVIAAHKGRAIIVERCSAGVGEIVKAAIVRDKHNIFRAVAQ